MARLASRVVVLENGPVARAGPAEQVLSDPGMVHQIGLREAGAVLPATVARHHADGLTELAVSGGRLFLPLTKGAPGTAVRVRVLAQDVMLAHSAPVGLSALNILPGKVVSLRDGDGPGVMVQIACGDDLLLARITRSSCERLQLAPQLPVFAQVKSVALLA